MVNIPIHEYKFLQSETEVQIYAGLVRKTLKFTPQGIHSQIHIDDICFSGPENYEFSFQISQAMPNAMPPQLSEDQGGEIRQTNTDSHRTDGLQIDQQLDERKSAVISWVNPFTLHSHKLNSYFKNFKVRLVSPTQCHLVWHDSNIEIDVIYEIYPQLPVFRKWITITNHSDQWKRIENLTIDGCEVADSFPKRVDLTPSERGACACMIGFSTPDDHRGIILGSEVPSALRTISTKGALGYSVSLFEWVLGPGEHFISEPIFMFAYCGEIQKFGKNFSTPLERTVEMELKEFIERILKIPAAIVPLPGPLWCTWSNFVANINDSNIREQATLAAECGFKTFQIDAGWSLSETPSDWTAGGAEFHPEKFPDFAHTTEFIQQKGLNLGLWLSCFRSSNSKDLRDLPFARSVPIIKRGKCYGMSFASPWRDYYANDVIHLASQYHAVYFKQDLTNLKFGDIGIGHESRTLKESYLRGLRGLLDSQKQVFEKSPNIWTLLSHEIYWGTPGVPCDLAALKSACAFHIPPNDYSGCGPRRERWSPKWRSSMGAKTWELRLGCLHARKRYYVHRGLPLYTIEYYGAATVNIQGSLTSEIQDRQICSWLMGALSVFAGDLSSLTLENRVHYRKRFELVKNLHAKYNILRYCQFSGVPAPTDFGWHWYGKLNSDREGIVIVLRGWAGTRNHHITIPWVHSEKKYQIRQLFSQKNLGDFPGKELQTKGVKISLPRWGQEILECILKKNEM